MNRCYENMELLEIQGKEKKNFFISYVDVPGKDEEITVEHVVEQLRRKVLEPLHERYGTDISDAAMRKLWRSTMRSAGSFLRWEKCEKQKIR